MTTQFYPATGFQGFGGFGNGGPAFQPSFQTPTFTGQFPFGPWNPAFFGFSNYNNGPFFGNTWPTWNATPFQPAAFGPGNPWNGSSTAFGQTWDGRGFGPGPFAGNFNGGYASGGFGFPTQGQAWNSTGAFPTTGQGWNGTNAFPWAGPFAPTGFSTPTPFASGPWATPWAAGGFFNPASPFPFAGIPTFNSGMQGSYGAAVFAGSPNFAGPRTTSTSAEKANGCCGGIGINREAA